MGKASLLQLNGEDDPEKPIAASWHQPIDQVKNWKVGDRPLVHNELEKLTRED